MLDRQVISVLLSYGYEVFLPLDGSSAVVVKLPHLGLSVLRTRSFILHAGLPYVNTKDLDPLSIDGLLVYYTPRRLLYFIPSADIKPTQMRLESSFVLEPLTGVAVESAQMYKQLQAESAMVSEAETEHQFYDRILNQRD
jgi:hypothetical protein